MLPSLKTSYENQLLKTLEEIKKNPELLREVVDQRMVDEMDRSLSKLTKILSNPELASLESFHLGLQKAHTELSNVLDYGDVRSWVQSVLPQGFTALGRLAAFTTGLTKLLKQLPKIVNIVKGRMNAERRADWNESQPMSQLLDTAAANKLLSIIVKAMKPEGISLGGGLPYVNDKEAASEILNLSYNQLLSFSQSSQAIETPIAPMQAKELGKDIQSVTGGNQVEPAQKPAQTPAGAESSGERLVIPGAERGSAPVAAKASPAQTPSAQAMESDLSDIYDETLFNWLGEKGMSSKNFKEFKPKFIRNMLVLMQKKSLIKRVSKPQA